MNRTGKMARAIDVGWGVAKGGGQVRPVTGKDRAGNGEEIPQGTTGKM